jgi:Zn-dependent metalloprotease
MSKRALAVAVLTAAGCAALAASALAAPPDRAAAIARALAFIGQNPASVHSGAGQAFVARDVVADADGSEHVRFDRTYRGLRVLGGDIVLHGDGRGAFSGVSGALRAPLNVSTRAVVNAAAAAEIAGRAFGADGLAEPAELVVDAADAPALAWEIVIRGTAADGTPREMHYLVDARSGTIRDSWDGIETSAAIGTGQSFFNGTVALTTDFNGLSSYSMRDPSRGNQYTTDMNNGTSGNGTLFTDTDNSWGNGALSSRQTIAVDAQYGTAETWDYYLNVHNRDGIADDGTGAFNRVHYSSGYNNAFWSDSCFCMTYGDGDGVTFNPFDSLDVAGHEMSHGVTSRTANLRYSGESGGLNEGTSDIFGTMVEFHANNSSETPDYLIGERLYKSGGGKALRYMYRPSKDGASADCWSRNLKRLDVHYSSGVANHFFFLLAEGSGVSSFTDATGATTCNGSTLTGIGRSDAERIWYRALTVYMTSRTAYSGARAATLSAASDLFGAGSPEVSAVAAAWSSVNVN